MGSLFDACTVSLQIRLLLPYYIGDLQECRPQSIIMTCVLYQVIICIHTVESKLFKLQHNTAQKT